MRRVPGKAAAAALAVGLSFAALLSAAGTAPAGSPPDATPIDEDLLRITKPKQNSIVKVSLGRRVEISGACSDPCRVSGRVRIQIGTKRKVVRITPSAASQKTFLVRVTLSSALLRPLKRKPQPKKSVLRAAITAEVLEDGVPLRTDTDVRAVRLR